MRNFFRQMRAALGLVGLLVTAGVWLAVPQHWRLRRAIVVGAWRSLLWGFAIRVRRHGVPLHRSDGVGTLLVANHVSWSDIPVLGRVVDAGFVAKGEVGEWPVIGRLSAEYGCLFVVREARGAAGQQAAALGAMLEAGHSVILFPEGTTGEGDTCLPFRSSLFALIPAGTMVQPVTLRYSRTDGSALSPHERRAVAWIDDDGLLEHARALALRGGLTADLWFHDAMPATERKALTRACFAVIEGKLAEARAMPPAG